MENKLYDSLGRVNVDLLERAELASTIRKMMLDLLPSVPDEHVFDGVLGALNSLSDSLRWTAQEIEYMQRDIHEQHEMRA